MHGHRWNLELLTTLSLSAEQICWSQCGMWAFPVSGKEIWDFFWWMFPWLVCVLEESMQKTISSVYTIYSMCCLQLMMIILAEGYQNKWRGGETIMYWVYNGFNQELIIVKLNYFWSIQIYNMINFFMYWRKVC